MLKKNDQYYCEKNKNKIKTGNDSDFLNSTKKGNKITGARSQEPTVLPWFP